MKEFPTADQIVEGLVLPAIRETVEDTIMPAISEVLITNWVDDENWDEDSLEDIAHDENHFIDSQERR